MDWLYVSVRGEDRIAQYALDRASGALSPVRDVPVAGGPAPMAMAPDHRCVYVGLRGACQLAAFAWDRQDGGLTPLNTAALDTDPCFVTTDRTGRYLVSAYYRGGKVTVHALNADGSIGPDPVQSVPTAPNAHGVYFLPNNRYAFVPHTESNRVYFFAFNADTGRLTPCPTPWYEPEDMLGPRHAALHPHLPLAYVSNEKASSVSVYRYQPDAGAMTLVTTASTLPPPGHPGNTCAQIHLAATGRRLYVSNRGHDSIACFDLDADTGAPRLVANLPTEKTPRAFNLACGGRYMYVAGQASATLAAYRVRAEVPMPELIARYPVGDRPMWVMPVTA